MVMFVVAAALLALHVSAETASTNGTGNGADRLVQPAPSYARHRNNSVVAVLTQAIDQAFDVAFENKTWDVPQDTVKTFTAAFVQSRFKSLGGMINSVVPTCGDTLINSTPVNTTSLTSMIWQNDEARVGFSHHGPCEAWIDQRRVFHSECCRQSFSGYPAEIPIDFSKCPGTCLFKFYWLTLDEPEWRAYKQCVPIVYSRVNSTNSPTNATISENATTSENAPTVESGNSTVGRVHAAATVEVAPPVIKVST